MKQESIISRATLTDSRRIADLINKNLNHVLYQHYSQEQIVVWKKYYKTSAIKEKIMNECVFIARRNATAIGTITLADNRIKGMYVAYHKLNEGIGRSMMEYVIDFALTRGVTELRLTSVPISLGFYKRMGFRVRRKTNVVYFGVSFEEIEMEKRLKIFN